MNASLSFTLSESKTVTEARAVLREKAGDDVRFEFYFEGRRNKDFEKKIHTFFGRVVDYIPGLKAYEWRFESRNTFPHSSGIASSASGFAALSKILSAFEQTLLGSYDDMFASVKASFLARLGSGSASRSIFPGINIWGHHPDIPGSSDLYAIPFPYEVHPVFDHFRDWIVLVDSGKKQVSSTQGHALIDTHPFKNQRINVAEKNMNTLISAIKTGDLEVFGRIVEAEALMLHALMMTSQPDFILMKPDTLHLILELRRWRADEKIPVFFTLDAGANVHLLFPDSQANRVERFLGAILPQVKVIRDFVQ